jgi:hypothetical protein
MPDKPRRTPMTLLTAKSPPRARPSVDTYDRPYIDELEDFESRSAAEEITSWAILVGWAVVSFTIFAIAVGVV